MALAWSWRHVFNLSNPGYQDAGDTRALSPDAHSGHPAAHAGSGSIDAFIAPFERANNRSAPKAWI
jgi:hypothetical protein